MTKKLSVGFLILTVVTPIFPAVAQTAPGSIGSTNQAEPAIDGNTGIINPSPMIRPPVVDNGDIIQFNNLEIVSVELTSALGRAFPVEIIVTRASDKMYYYNNFEGGANVGSGLQASPPPVSADTTCLKFNSQNSGEGVSIPCPLPRAEGASTPASQPGMSGDMKYVPDPTYSFRIKVAADTKLLLKDRTIANISHFAQGDKINVYGFYNIDGSVEALIVRNLSKPIQKTFYQLDNVELVSISGTTAPTTLVVMHQPTYPCYWFGIRGDAAKQSYPCPASLPPDNISMERMNLPSSLMPVWQAARKYEIKVDSATIFLDRNRNRISLASLKLGDKLNIYGEMEGSNGIMSADIIRDISQPPAISNLEGKITQINSDGSFLIQANNGQTYTVGNPITVGATVKLSGILDELQKTISQVSQLVITNKINVLNITPKPAIDPPCGECYRNSGQ